MVSTINVQNSSVSKEDLPGLLGTAVVFFRLRDLLTKYGIPPEDDVKIKLSIKDKEAENFTEPISFSLPKGNGQLSVETPVKSLSDAITDDFLMPADMMYKLADSFLEAFEIPPPKVVSYKLTLESMIKSDMPKFSIVLFSYCLRPPQCPTLWCPYP